ncbi:hypothetical protein [Mesobacillus foraminis]|nr:hypothetical protein [Mesobacillus foraminis]
MMKRTKIGKILYYTGILLFAAGFAFNQRIGIADTPEPYGALSLPLIVAGIVLVITSNFYKQVKENKQDV